MSDDTQTAHLPLSGLGVLDLTLARAGPTCVRHLADWGADVIAVLPPGEGRDVIARDGFDFQNLHRNKRFISLDLKTERGHVAFLKLAERADVLVENMRAPVKAHRLKIAYEGLKADQPSPGLRLDQWLRPGRALCSARGRRPDRPGARRPDVDHRRAGPGADARWHRDF